MIRVANFRPSYLKQFWVKIQSFCAHWTRNFLNFSKLTQFLSVAHIWGPLEAFKHKRAFFLGHPVVLSLVNWKLIFTCNCDIYCVREISRGCLGLDPCPHAEHCMLRPVESSLQYHFVMIWLKIYRLEQPRQVFCQHLSGSRVHSNCLLSVLQNLEKNILSINKASSGNQPLSWIRFFRLHIGKASSTAQDGVCPSEPSSKP